jgi:hypothetical protein
MHGRGCWSRAENRKKLRNGVMLPRKRSPMASLRVRVEGGRGRRNDGKAEARVFLGLETGANGCSDPMSRILRFLLSTCVGGRKEKCRGGRWTA